MKIGDIIKLSLGGYDTQAIKELGELSKNSPEVLDLAKAGKKLPEIKELFAMAEAEETPANNATPEQGESAPTPDYRKLYEEQKAKVDELSETVSKIQHDNAGKEIPQPEEGDPFKKIAGILGI